MIYGEKNNCTIDHEHKLTQMLGNDLKNLPNKSKSHPK